MAVVNVIVIGEHHIIKSVCNFLYRGFGRTCECELPEGVDPNKNQGSGYDKCPLVNLLSWLLVYIL